MEAIHALAIEYGFSVIEDASHAIGAQYQQKPVGACEFSDITVFSFHPVKIITTGEGGIATSKSAEIAQRLELARSHGVTRDPNLMNDDTHGPWYYQQISLGYNYRMTDIQAALGLSQLSRLSDFVATRNTLASRYDKTLQGLPIDLPKLESWAYSSWHLYIIRLNLDCIKKTRNEVFTALREKNIGVNVHYIPVHTQPYYKAMGFNEGQFPCAETHYQQAISLPLYPGLSELDQDYIADCLRELLL